MNKSHNIEAIYPLSPLQQGILFHAVYDPESNVYFEQLSCEIRGDLNVDALHRAWEAVVDRHPILRTGFFWQRRKTPLQAVLRKVHVPWDQQDWRGLSDEEQQKGLRNYLEWDRKRGFALSKAPLMRVALMRRAEAGYYLVWSHHHLLLDGWSVPIVLKDVFGFYDAFSKGRELHLEPAPSYDKHIAWLRRQNKAKADEFWRHALSGFELPTPLPVDRNVEDWGGESESYDEQRVALTASSTAALRRAAQAHSLTLNVLAQAAWALLLSCYSGREDVLFGAVVSGRPASLPGAESMVGLFVNTLPVRVRVEPGANLLDWLRRLQEQQIELLEYEYSSLVDIQGVSEVSRGTPLFESIFVFENYPIQPAALKNGAIEVGDVRVFERTNYPITVTATPDRELALDIGYDRRLFERATIAQMLDGLKGLLEAMLIDPGKRLAEVLGLAGRGVRLHPGTNEGVVGRRSAPSFEARPRESESSANAPRNRALEKRIAAIWVEVLGLESVEANHNFFELGGHSLLAMRVISRLQDVFQCELPVRIIFESPTVAGLARTIDSIIGSNEGRVDDDGERPRRDPEREFPLSCAQERLWFIDQLDPGSPAYNLPEAIRIEGRLNVPALNQCLTEIIRRHAVLRSVFKMVEGNPVQVVGHPRSVGTRFVGLNGLAHSASESLAKRLLHDDARTPFDLGRGPLLRVALLRMKSHDHVILFILHHIVADGWSSAVMIQEISELYQAFADGSQSPLQELPVQYAEFALWQRRQLQGDSLHAHLSYWKQNLAGAPALLRLPTDRPRPRILSHRGASALRVLREEVTEELKGLSRREGVTLFVTLLTALKVLLARYSGEDDIVVGVPVAGRARAEFENLIGFFVNNLVIRTKIDPDATFQHAMRAEKEAVIGAFAHQDVPFEKIIDELRPERSLSHAPLFQVAFNFVSMPIKHVGFSELSLTPVDFEVGISKFDLVLAIAEIEGTLLVDMRYATDLFDRATVEQMLDHFKMLLDQAAANPRQVVSAISLLAAAERRRLLADRNPRRALSASLTLIHELFDRQARESPVAVALVHNELHVTYAELNRRANRLARHLQAVGVGLESLVGIFMERSVEMVLSVLAVLKAGGGYLPLDPLFPPERISLLLDEGGVEVVLTRLSAAHRLPRTEALVIELDSEWSTIGRLSEEEPASLATVENLAYVIYTSGSTGLPKGVMIAHGGVCNLARSQIPAFEIGPHSRVLQFAPFTFDASVSEMFTALLAGATLCVADPERLRPGAELIELLRDEAITVVTLPPSVLMVIRDEKLPALRTLIAAGEACSDEIIERWAIGRRFLNAYGPTESTVCATIAEIRGRGSSALIGRPMADIEVHLLDDHREPVPDRVVGEACLGGVGVSRGYVKRPDATAERFIPDPFGSTPGARLYRSGDLACYRRNGEIEYIGRCDHQVKVRGYRIELGEVEENLKRLPGVANAVAVIREGSSGEKVITGYVAMNGDGEADTDALRRLLARRLPEYMLPHSLIALDRLPLLANGKIDRAALPLEPAHAKPAQGHQPPRTRLEALLVRMWQEILGIERVGVFDPFFELGGDSLRAAIFTNRLQEMFREVVHVVALFDAPTIAELAPYLELHCPAAVARICGDGAVGVQGFASAKTDSLKERESDVASHETKRQIEPVALEHPQAINVEAGPVSFAQATGKAWSAITRVPRGEGVGFPLSFAQQRLWFLNRLDPQSPFYNIPLIVRLIGPLDEGAFGSSINEVVRRHEVLRSRFVVSDGRPAQVIASELTAPLNMTDLRMVAGEEQEARMRRVVEEAATAPFDLEAGPLLRASLVRLSDNDHVAAVVMHHIVSDEWSVGVFVNEIAVLYDAFVDRKPSPLPELPVQYVDFAVWQRQWLQGEVLEAQLSYWKQQLAGAPGVLQLPTDRARPPIQSFRGSSCSLSLDDRLAEDVRQLSRRESVTLFVTMLTAFKLLLTRYTGEEDLVVGVPVAGRTRAEVEGLIGFFINALIMRTKLQPEAGFLRALKREKQVVLGAFAHQDLPFEKIVDELQPDRSLSHSPLFQVAFNYLNQPVQSVRMGDLSFGDVEFEMGTSKYDIVFAVVESGKELSAHARYCTDLFDRTTIEKLLGHFRILLESAVARPLERISGLPLLTEAERAQLLIERNDTTREFPTNLLIHALVDQHAGRQPNATALMCGVTHITYGELNRRSNQLANHLRSMGISPEAVVGICMKSSAEMVIAMLGVLKTGASYLPLDPDYPGQRLASIIEDSRIPLVITFEELDETLPAFSGQVVFLDGHWRQIQSFGDDEPGVSVLPENLAYVIYTSGSTGAPKGVQITHRGLLNLIFWHLTGFEVTGSDRATQVAGVGFDASVWEIWPYLAAGACLSLAEEGIRTSPAELQTWMLSNQATIAFLSTPLAESALVLDWPEQTCLRTLLTGGDRLHHHVRPGLPFALVNNYGPTEYTVVATSGIVEEREGEVDDAPAIGRPISNSQVYVLSRELEAAPERVAGELHIGGASLARAYLFDAELTAQKFIPNPFGSEPGTRIYKSGDLVRMRPDGNVEFLGRIDDQVKIRGVRIETGEIEAALSQHPGVVDSVVLADAVAGGESRLVAYVVSDPSQPPSIADLRTHLREKLPEYMIPAAFVALSNLPLTSNGKVDRRALPAPDRMEFGLDQELVPPRTELERYLARKWSEALGTDQIGVYDSFFDIGGESLKAAVLVNSIQQDLGEVLQVVTIFDAPTIADFAAYLSSQCGAAVARLLGVEREGTTAVAGSPPRKVDEHKIEQMRRLVVPLPPREPSLDSLPKNTRAIFILSSPRSGSTLLRVMMGGHPLLFAPPELELMSFNTLAERRKAFSGRDSFWLEGAIRAVMEIRRCNADQARRIIEDCEDVELTAPQFYRLLQSWLGDRLLVDKTPSYALDPKILERLEMDFEDALYIHLVRSPQGMIRSYEEAKLEQIFPRFKHPFEASELAEIVWIVSHQNILDFLTRVPSRRQHRVRFEDLVREPDEVVGGICRFIGLEYHPDMVEPYKDKERKMTDGIHKESRMLGDIKFHQHSAIDPAAAESWRGHLKDRILADAAMDLAGFFGYVADKPRATRPEAADTALRPIERAGADSVTEQMLAQLKSFSDDQLDSLLSQMLNEAEGNS